MNRTMKFNESRTLTYTYNEGSSLSLKSIPGDTEHNTINMKTYYSFGNMDSTTMWLRKEHLQALVRMYEQIHNEPLFDDVNE